MYYIIILNGSGKFIFRCFPRRKRLFALGSNKEISGAKKGVSEPVGSGAESDGQRVSSCGNRGGKRWKVGRLVVEIESEEVENGSANKKKVSSVLPNGVLSAPKWCPHR